MTVAESKVAEREAAPGDSSRESNSGSAGWLRWLFGLVVALGLGGVCAQGFVQPLPLYLAAGAGAVLLVIGMWVRWRAGWGAKLAAAAGVLLLLAAAGAAYVSQKYRVAETMQPQLVEFTSKEYPENPSTRSVQHGRYDGRELTLVHKDAAHFDFVLEPLNDDIARVVVRDVDVSLMTPSLPEWAKEDAGLTRIALTDRQWNRQQVRFDPNSPQVEITGGDGFERENLYSVELAKNCLNAGLWEVLLFVKENGGKSLYYQGWFTFPMGHYKEIFERNTGLPYVEHWHYLEHWVDPTGTIVPLDKLRRVVDERDAPVTFDPSEKLIARGEQITKRRTNLTQNIREWGDFYDGRAVAFASFVPPGRYSVDVPRDTEYGLMDRFEQVVLRAIESPGSDVPLAELEFVFSSRTQPGVCRFIVSGFDMDAVPALPIDDYPKGLYLPMGIGTPPFYQAYEELQDNPPDESPYVSVLLDGEDGWIDHHAVGVDGPVMHRDADDPSLLHVYLLSYERHSLVGHFVVELGETDAAEGGRESGQVGGATRL
ncbi:MAG: hypothetical protein DWQ34_20565 [Planctomycetota bacterium]|nr:MAG: hypothetical protein DWQ34_20565 [Planctomycetota bacterium]